MPSFYFWLPALGGAIVCSLLAYFLGLSFWKILVFTLVFWLPVTIFLGTVLHRTFNPQIEEYQPDSLDLKPHT